MKRASVYLSVSLLFLAGFVTLKLVNPVETTWLPKCTWRQLTGLHCPGCGLTRALDAIADGDLVAAFWFNPLVVAIGPVLALLLMARRRKERRGVRVNPTFCWLMFFVLVAYSFLRNYPSPDNGWLAPQGRPPQAVQSK